MDDATDPEADPPAELVAARQEVIEAMAQSAEVYGAKRSYGRLYGILFFAEEPLSLDELAERSEYAKSTVSTAMSALERFHMVRRRSIPGEGKRAYFEAETDFWTVLQEFLKREVKREIGTMTRGLDAAEERLESVDDERAQRDLERVRDLRSVYQRSERMVDLLTSSSLEKVVSLLDRLD